MWRSKKAAGGKEESEIRERGDSRPFLWLPFLTSVSRFNLEEENTENTESDEAEGKAEYRTAHCFLLELREKPGLWNDSYAQEFILSDIKAQNV